MTVSLRWHWVRHFSNEFRHLFLKPSRTFQTSLQIFNRFLPKHMINITQLSLTASFVRGVSSWNIQAKLEEMYEMRTIKQPAKINPFRPPKWSQQSHVLNKPCHPHSKIITVTCHILSVHRGDCARMLNLIAARQMAMFEILSKVKILQSVNRKSCPPQLYLSLQFEPDSSTMRFILSSKEKLATPSNLFVLHFDWKNLLFLSWT